jgi:hypothetical protein
MEEGETIQGFQVIGVPGARAVDMAERAPAADDPVRRSDLLEIEWRLSERMDRIESLLDRVVTLLERRRA